MGCVGSKPAQGGSVRRTSLTEANESKLNSKLKLALLKKHSEHAHDQHPMTFER